MQKKRRKLRDEASIRSRLRYGTGTLNNYD